MRELHVIIGQTTDDIRQHIEKLSKQAEKQNIPKLSNHSKSIKQKENER